MKLSSFNFLGLGFVSFTKIHNRKLKRMVAAEDVESVSGVTNAGAQFTLLLLHRHVLAIPRHPSGARAASSDEQSPGPRLLCKPDPTFTVPEVKLSERAFQGRPSRKERQQAQKAALLFGQPPALSRPCSRRPGSQRWSSHGWSALKFLMAVPSEHIWF